jgi:hypothetical protein
VLAAGIGELALVLMQAVPDASFARPHIAAELLDVCSAREGAPSTPSMHPFHLRDLVLAFLGKLFAVLAEAVVDGAPPSGRLAAESGDVVPAGSSTRLCGGERSGAEER